MDCVICKLPLHEHESALKVIGELPYDTVESLMRHQWHKDVTKIIYTHAQYYHDESLVDLSLCQNLQLQYLEEDLKSHRTKYILHYLHAIVEAHRDKGIGPTEVTMENEMTIRSKLYVVLSNLFSLAARCAQRMSQMNKPSSYNNASQRKRSVDLQTPKRSRCRLQESETLWMERDSDMGPVQEEHDVHGRADVRTGVRPGCCRSSARHGDIHHPSTERPIFYICPQDAGPDVVLESDNETYRELSA